LDVEVDARVQLLCDIDGNSPVTCAGAVVLLDALPLFTLGAERELLSF
jgi:hypothetical protein